MTTAILDIIDLEDIGSEARRAVSDLATLGVAVVALASSTWNSGVLTLQVSYDGVWWFDAVTLTGSTPPTLSADGTIEGVYVGDVLWARVVVTTVASSSTRVEVRWS